MHDKISVKDSTQICLVVDGKKHWAPAIPHPFYTTKGLPFWKRFNESNWRPQCGCGRIFNTKEDYDAHVIYHNSVYGRASN